LQHLLLKMCTVSSSSDPVYDNTRTGEAVHPLLTGTYSLVDYKC